MRWMDSCGIESWSLAYFVYMVVAAVVGVWSKIGEMTQLVGPTPRQAGR